MDRQRRKPPRIRRQSPAVWRRKLAIILLFAVLAAFFGLTAREIAGRMLAADVNTAYAALGGADGDCPDTAPHSNVPPAKLLKIDLLAIDTLSALAAPFDPGGPRDWIASNPERGQWFNEYVFCRPVRPDREKYVQYVLPIGTFDVKQQEILELTAEHLGLFYRLPVKILDGVGIDDIPESVRRINPWHGMEQILSGYCLDNILAPRLPSDGLFIEGLTTSDLWPGRNWNFVFGQADLYRRVGVSSMFRIGNPSSGPEGFRNCLLRMIKTMVHEAGHMYSIRHCTAFECVMNGCNSIDEADRRPLELCPDCLKKLRWGIGFDPVRRYEDLSLFYARVGLDGEQAVVDERLKLLTRERAKGLAAYPAGRPQ